MPTCDGEVCFELIYDAKVINLHEFRIARLYMPGRDEPPGCTTPTESETRELMEHFENFVVKRLERDDSARSGCPEGCQCVYNGRFSEWSEWMEYPGDRLEVVAHTSRDDGKTVCEWKVHGAVKVRYKKRLGDCFRARLFPDPGSSP